MSMAQNIANKSARVNVRMTETVVKPREASEIPDMVAMATPYKQPPMSSEPTSNKDIGVIEKSLLLP